MRFCCHLFRTLWSAVWRNPVDLDTVGPLVLVVYRFGIGLLVSLLLGCTIFLVLLLLSTRAS